MAWVAEVRHTILTGAWSRKRRLLATAISVILGVAFLMGTLVIGTSARAGFETAFGDANAGTDALVRSADQLDAGEQPLSRPFDEAVRSEEHTSELQSLMSISYAVLCLT